MSDRDRHIVCFGATSAIAAAYLKTRAAEGGVRFTLVGRSQGALESIATELAPARADVLVVDVLNRDFCDGLGQHFDGLIDEAVIAFARLDNQTKVGHDRQVIAAQFDLNLTVTALLAEGLVLQLEPTFGTLVVIGSTAADRARPTNYAYGASKAGLDYFLDGLSYQAEKLGVHVVQVKPGLTNSAMTRAAARPTTLMVEPGVVGRDMLRGIKRHKRIIYSPGYWRWIMLVTKLLPRWVLAKVRV